MKGKMVGGAIALLSGILTAGLAHAQSAAMGDADRAFMMRAAEGGAAEVALGRLAVERATNAPVRDFGQRMVIDHGAAGDQLAALAARKGVVLPREPGADGRAVHGRLAAVPPAEFDRAYMMEMVRDHDQDVREFEIASQSAQDAELRAWTAQILPTLREHQRMARQLGSALAQAPSPVITTAPSALPAAVIVTPGVVARPWCQGAWNVTQGTNFGTCRQ